MSEHILSKAEANRSFSMILNKVHFQHQSFVIKKGKEIIAKIMPVTPSEKFFKVNKLNELFKRIPSLEKEDSKAFEKSIKKFRAHMQVNLG